MSWIPYQKIDTANARDLKGNKRIIEGTYRDRAVWYLKDLKWEATEKADGLSLVIWWDGYKARVSGGRNQQAERIEPIYTVLEESMCSPESEQLFEQMFKRESNVDEQGNPLPPKEVEIFGEVIGPGIQKVGKLYGDTQRFLVFDIMVDKCYLEHSSDFYQEIVKAFGLEEVPTLPDMTIEEAIAFVKSNPRSWINSNAPMEGVVLRPQVRLYGPNGSRLIVKIKAKDYAPYNPFADKYRWVKKGKCVVYNCEEPAPESRVLCIVQHRCTIQKIVSDSEKIENENTVMTLREVDTGRQFFMVHANEVEPYNKEKWNENQENNSKGPENGN